MPTNSSRNRAGGWLTLGDLAVYPDRALVRRGDTDVPIRQQTLRVLLYLVEHRERVVSRDELHDAIWGETAVTPDALVQCIVEIRRLLGDSAREPRFIRTVPKLGYAYVGPAPAAPDAPVAPQAPPAPLAPWKRYAPYVAAAVVLIALMALARMGPRAPRWSNDPAQKRLVLLPFTNASADLSIAWLQSGLPNMLMTGLGRSPAISAITIADGEEGRKVARAGRADGIVSGSFTAVGDSLRVDVRIEAADGTTLATDALVARRQDAVLSEIDHLAERLIAAVGVRVPAAASTQLVGEVMTRDLDAYRDYILGVQRANAFEPDAAIDFFERAIKRDPDFAMAHARIGATHAVTMGDPAKGQPYLEKAFQLSDRLRERDRLWILAWYSLAKVDFESAIAPLQTLIAKYPDDAEAYVILANILTGQERWTAASDVLNRGLTLNPDSKELLNQASAVATLSGKRDAAIEAARRYVALAPHEANAFDSLGLRLHHFGQYDDAIAAFEQALRMNPRFDLAVVHVGNAYFAQGRYRDATAAYERFLQMSTTDDSRARAYGAMAWIAFRAGDERARELADRAFSLSKRGWWPALLFAIDRGDLASYRRIKEASTAEDTFSNRGAPWPPILQHYWASLDMRATRRTEQAIGELREAVRHPAVDWNVWPLEDCLGDALFTLKRLDEARAEYQRLASAQPWSAWYHYRLAQIAEHDGDAAAAGREFQQFLQLWPKADRDALPVTTARGRISTLASR